MEKLKVTFMALLMAIVSAVPTIAANTTGKPVKFTEVRNYFHNNDAPMPDSLLFTTQAQFDRHFSPAAFMGKDGQPTVIDFKRQAVVAIVLPVTDKQAEIKDVSLISTGKNKLQLSYTAHYGARRSYSTQTIYLMAIDGKYRNASVDVKANVIEDPETITNDFRNTRYIDNARHLDISIDYPVTPGYPVMSSVQEYEDSLLARYAAAFSYKDNTKRPLYGESDCDFARMLSHYTAIYTDSMKTVDKENNAPDRPCTAQIKIMRTDETDSYLTIQASGYCYMGGAHGISVDEGATFDKQTGRRAAIVKGSEGLTKLISNKIPAEVKESILVDSIPMPKTPAYLKDGRVVFLYQTGEIAANAAGAITVTFWPDEISSYLTEEGKILTSTK